MTDVDSQTQRLICQTTIVQISIYRQILYVSKFETFSKKILHNINFDIFEFF